MKKKISQQEARRLKKRVEELEGQLNQLFNRFTMLHPGVNLGSLTLEPDWFRGRIEASQMLGHAVCVRLDRAQCHFYAVKRLA